VQIRPKDSSECSHALPLALERVLELEGANSLLELPSAEDELGDSEQAKTARKTAAANAGIMILMKIPLFKDLSCLI
jgi:hypothetical protein